MRMITRFSPALACPVEGAIALLVLVPQPVTAVSPSNPIPIHRKNIRSMIMGEFLDLFPPRRVLGREGNRSRNSPMIMLRMFLRWIGIGLLGLTAVTGCGTSTNKAIAPSTGQASAGEKRVIILINGNSPFWDTCRAGLQEAEKDLKLKDVGLRAVLEVNDGTPQGQLTKLRQFASQSDV